MSKITFHAPRGGTGRSLALANVAVDLAMKQKRVGIVDLDVEAGGLVEIFGIPSTKLSGGLIEILKNGNVDLLLPDYVIELNKILKIKTTISLFFLPTIVNSENLQLLEGWPTKMTDEITLKIIDDFWRDFSLDYLLIDSRTGASQWASVALSEANLIVLMTRLNRQGLSGCKRLLPQFHAHNIEVLVVGSSVPNPTKNQEKVQKAMKIMGYKFDHVLPYAEAQAFDETLLVLKSPSSALSKAYSDLADAIIAK